MAPGMMLGVPPIRTKGREKGLDGSGGRLKKKRRGWKGKWEIGGIESVRDRKSPTEKG